MKQKKIQYLLALTRTHGIGKEMIKNLLPSFDNDAEALCTASDMELLQIKGINKASIQRIRSAVSHLKDASAEMEQLDRADIEIIPIYASSYPYRLKRCMDAPAYLYKKGDCDLNPLYSVAIVGTRKATNNGKKNCKKIIEEIASIKPLIISGLAFGIDASAHKEALAFGLPTTAVMGHGLSLTYPPQHHGLARQILAKGGALLSEYPYFKDPEKGYFAERNRIIAGMSDVVVVVEAAIRGGAHITAELAAGYFRDVMAVPGRPDDEFARGCNKLIKENKANLIENGKDLIELMNWQTGISEKKIQRSLLYNLTVEQEQIAEILRGNGEIHIDEISFKTDLLPAKLAGILLDMELLGIIKALPGKRFTWI